MSKYGSVKSEPAPFLAYQVNPFVLIDTLLIDTLCNKEWGGRLDTSSTVPRC